MAEGEALFLSIGGAATRAARLDAKGEIAAHSIYPHTDTEALQTGEIYAARIASRTGARRGAFLDLGGAEAFLDAPSPAAEGAPLLVQIKREARGDKLATATEKISLSGLYAAFLPAETGVGVARNIGDTARARLLALGRALSADLPAGRILWRSAAADAPEGALRRQIGALADEWRRLKGAFDGDPAPRRLSSAPLPLDRAIAEQMTGRVTQILIDRADIRPEAERIVDEFAPAAPVAIELAPDRMRDILDFEAAFAAALSPYAALPGGGALALEATDLGWTVDIDSGASGASAKAINLAAAREIPRQLALRGAGGLIVIDFINAPPRDFSAVKQALRDAARGDPELGPPVFDDRLCLAHLTRRARRPSLLDQLTEPSGPPHIGGRRLTTHACAISAFSALETALARDRASRLRLTIAPEVADIVAAHAGWREDAAARFGARFDIAVGETYAREDHDISTI
ncbi:MAG: ribonuclease E/G [Parvularculaceae bacterium]